jgi:hypothetical protein
MSLLPKRFNVEMRFWDSAHAAWRAEQQRTRGADAVPLDVFDDGRGASLGLDDGPAAASTPSQGVALLHYVGRDKPWMRYERAGAHADTAEELCRKLREKDADTCARYLYTQALWWRTFGEGRCLIVGDAATSQAQGFVIDAFEVVLRMHRPSMPPRDAGNVSRPGNVRCEGAASCLRAAAAAGCVRNDAVLSLGRERGLDPLTTRSLLSDVYRAKLGTFGGPAGADPRQAMRGVYGINPALAAARRAPGLS